MGRVAGGVGPARRTDLEEAMHKERKNGHVPGPEAQACCDAAAAAAASASPADCQ